MCVTPPSFPPCVVCSCQREHRFPAPPDRQRGAGRHHRRHGHPRPVSLPGCFSWDLCGPGSGRVAGTGERGQCLNAADFQAHSPPTAASLPCRTPLMLAIMNGHVDCVHLLLEKGSTADAADKRGRTALHRGVSASRGPGQARSPAASARPPEQGLLGEQAGGFLCCKSPQGPFSLLGMQRLRRKQQQKGVALLLDDQRVRSDLLLLFPGHRL